MKTRRNTRLIALILLALGAGLSWQWTVRRAQAAPAATLLVTSSNDNQIGVAGCADGCSLREAITTAASGDTINFSPAFSTTIQFIRLSHGEYLINKSLTINGPGINQLTISGEETSRVFNCVFRSNVNTDFGPS